MQALQWWRGNVLAGAWSAWAAIVQHSRQKRACMARAAGQYEALLHRKAMTAWWHIALQRGRARQLLQAACARLAHRSLCLAFDAW